MKNFKKFLLASCYGLGTFGIEIGTQMKCNDYIDNDYDDDSKLERICHFVGIMTEHTVLMVAMFGALNKLARKVFK